jgi:ornithine decarboxylase
MAPSALYLDDHLNLSANDLTKSILANDYLFNDHHGSHTLIGQALKQRIDDIDDDTCEVGGEDAFFVADLGQIYRQHMRWKVNLNRINPHYGTSIFHNLDSSLTINSCQM